MIDVIISLFDAEAAFRAPYTTTSVMKFFEVDNSDFAPIIFFGYYWNSYQNSSIRALKLIFERK